MTDEERKLIRDHKKWLETLTNFTCVSCLMPRAREKVGKIDVFRPTKKYSLCRTSTYIICDECMKLPDEEIDAAVETWLTARGHLVV
jgi:hypothetical protein